MNYKEQIDQAKRAAEKWKSENPIVGVGRLRVDLMVDDLCRSITDLLSRAEAAEARCALLDEARENANEACAKWEGMYHMALERAEKAEITASDLCDDFTDFVTSGVYNAAPYCANCRIECVNARGWCNGDNKVCRGFMPKAAVWKEE